MNEVLVVDDELERGSELGQEIVDLVEIELNWKCVFVKNQKEALKKMHKNTTRFAFLDIKFEGESPQTVKELEKEIKRQRIPYIILSNFDFPKVDLSLSKPYSILNKVENKIREKIVDNSLKSEQRIPLQNLLNSVGEIKGTIEKYKEGEKDKKDVLRVLKDKQDLLEYFKSDLEQFKNVFSSKPFPEKVGSYPEKFYRVETIVKREFWNKRPYIRNLILSSTSTVPLTKSCTMLLYKENMSCCIKNEDDQVIGTFSFSAKNTKEKNAWEMLIKCKEAYPAPVEFLDEYTFKYADVINRKTRDCTVGKLHHLVEKVKGGSGKYKLANINIDNPKRDELSEKQNQYVTRKEFETFKVELFKRIEDLLKITPQQKLRGNKKNSK